MDSATKDMPCYNRVLDPSVGDLLQTWPTLPESQRRGTFFGYQVSSAAEGSFGRPEKAFHVLPPRQTACGEPLGTLRDEPQFQIQTLSLVPESAKEPILADQPWLARPLLAGWGLPRNSFCNF